ncbi:hypothetical protein [Streptomyces nymphaeiformis]|uniref:Preprotein translocase subunit SecB n=1 Tax=Streptomyces nymphaeiformis TaxID=2663842 RepID=A0A7W7TXF0_9ACTN|nr:hypothetical protein [Streptomyces nymphaeiformis]MBB4979725.1 hypothetical protein [Streptomyces nymphaeiformis]
MAFLIPRAEEQRQLAAPVNAYAELLDVRIFLLHGEALKVDVTSDLQEIETLQTNMGIGRDGSHITYQFEHVLTAQDVDGTDALKVQVNLGVLFGFPGEDDPNGAVSEESLVAFGYTTAQLAAHPYLRSAVADVTSKLGFPQVTLGLLKS